MRARLLLFSGLAVAVLGGIALIHDALVVSDEEAVEALLDELAEEGVAATLSWADPSVEPVAVQVHGRVRRHRDPHGLESAVGRALEVFEGDVEVVQRSVAVRGNRARASMRVRSREGLHDARFDLVRRGDRWLLTRLVAG